MNVPQLPWWVWLAGIFLILGLADGDVSIFPLVILGFILFKVLGGRSRAARRPGSRTQVGHGPAHGGYGTDDRQGPAQQLGTTPQDSQMPTIDVPRYPGGPAYGPGSPAQGVPTQPPGVPTQPPGVPTQPPGLPGVPTPPPRPGYGAGGPSVSTGYPGPGSTPPGTGSQAAPGTGAYPAPASGAPHTSTDPVVSLGQLHLSRCGRDLQEAVRHGTATDVGRVLDETKDMVGRMQQMLGAADVTPGSGRREFRAGLRALDRLVDDARGEHPPGAKVTRVTQACLRMGQTGRHE